MSRDFVSVVEAAWHLSRDDDTWVRSLVTTSLPVFGTGLGGVGFLIDSLPDQTPNVLAFCGEGLSEKHLNVVPAIIATPPDTRRTQFITSHGPAGTLRDSLGEYYDEPNGFGEAMKQGGVEDALYLFCGDTWGVSCVLAAPAERVLNLEPAERATWSLLSAHVAAAQRLRKRDDDGEGDAVLSPEGKLLDATGDAQAPEYQEALSAAVKSAELARGRMRRESPEEALALWSALVAGRWSLVDRVDSDGRRFLVARRNSQRERRHARLTVRETEVAALAGLGHSNKLVAYELGVTESTVATQLTRAMAKLGVNDRLELVALMSSAFPSEGS